MTTTRRADLTVSCLLGLGAVATLAVYLLPHAPEVRSVLVVPFLFGGVGYLIMSALFPGGARDPALASLLTLSLSVSGIVIVALTLDLIGVPLTPRSGSAGLLAMVTVAVGIRWWRLRGAERSPVTKIISTVRSSRLVTPIVATLVGGAAVASMIVVLSSPLTNHHVAGYTFLSAVRRGDHVLLQVNNDERAYTRYRLVVRTSASGPAPDAAFSLAPGQTWTRLLAMRGPPLQSVDARLYRVASPTTVYRHVALRP